MEIHIGLNIKKLAESKNLKAPQIAYKWGRSVQQVYNLFKNADPTASSVYEMSRILGVTPNEIYGLEKSDVKHEEMSNETLIYIKKDLYDSVIKQLDIKEGRIFDCYTDQVTNRYLKDIAKLLKIRKTITYHVSRHTFATLFLDKTNDLATLQKLMGHHSIAQTMVYAHVSETKKREQIRVFDQIF